MSEAVAPEQLITAEQFWELYAGKEGRTELVYGKVVEMPPVGPTHGDLDVRFVLPLAQYMREHGLGKVFLNTGFVLRAAPDLIRAPDEAFVSMERLAQSPPPKRGFWPAAPDLAVKIVSPDDSASDINQKVLDYLEHGVRMVWVIHPPQKQVHVYRRGESIRIVLETGTLSGEDVLPGFGLHLAELWAQVQQ